MCDYFYVGVFGVLRRLNIRHRLGEFEWSSVLFGPKRPPKYVEGRFGVENSGRLEEDPNSWLLVLESGSASTGPSCHI